MMKGFFKKFAVKILSIVVAAVILGAGGFFAYEKFFKKPLIEVGHTTVSNIEIVKEKLESTAELNTGSYLCTSVLTKSDSKNIKGWKIPLTSKSYVISYDGVIKAGISDLTKAEIIEKDEVVTVKLPKVEITGVEIDNQSFKKIDETNNIFNPITLDDLNAAQVELKEKMKSNAVEKGILELAKTNAETLLTNLLKSTSNEYEVKIEWQE